MKNNLLKFTLTGTSPLLMHSDRYANPLDPLTKKHKTLTSKRKKTDEDHELILQSEWIGSLYLNEKGEVCVPGICVQSCLMEAARMQKLGKVFKRAITVVEDKIALQYEGPKNVEKLWENEKFRDVRSVKVGTSKIMRCRPLFLQWSLDFSVIFYPELISDHEIIEAMKNAGKFVGLLDFRPKFGRFDVKV